MLRNSRRDKRSQQQWGGLKAALIVGSLAATLAGMRMLALQEPVETSTSTGSVPVSIQEPTVVIVPAASSSLPLPPNGARGVQVGLAPIPEAVTPNIQPVQPVARARSSR